VRNTRAPATVGKSSRDAALAQVCTDHGATLERQRVGDGRAQSAARARHQRDPAEKAIGAADRGLDRVGLRRRELPSREGGDLPARRRDARHGGGQRHREHAEVGEQRREGAGLGGVAAARREARDEGRVGVVGGDGARRGERGPRGRGVDGAVAEAGGEAQHDAAAVAELDLRAVGRGLVEVDGVIDPHEHRPGELHRERCEDTTGTGAEAGEGRERAEHAEDDALAEGRAAGVGIGPVQRVDVVARGREAREVGGGQADGRVGGSSRGVRITGDRASGCGRGRDTTVAPVSPMNADR
jgi:hypothetical protein